MPENQTTGPLTIWQQRAMREFKERLASGQTMGRRKYWSMFNLSKRGLATPVHNAAGNLVDWKITPAGEAWND